MMKEDLENLAIAFALAAVLWVSFVTIWQRHTMTAMGLQ